MLSVNLYNPYREDKLNLLGRPRFYKVITRVQNARLVLLISTLIIIQVGEGLLVILHLCLNISVYSKSTYNVVEFITPKKLLYLQYTIINIFNVGFFSKNASFLSYLNFSCLFLIGSHGHTHFMKYCNYNCHMIIILYTNSDYNNTLYYMLLEIQLKQEQMDRLLKSTLQG